MNQSSVKKGLTVKDLVTVGIFSALFLVFALVGGIIMGLEHGFDTVVGSGGGHLSGGEKQRISIARSLLKRSPILMADEATASLDAETAHQVAADLLDLDSVTRIVVTHALEEALLRRYDGIVALKDGRVAETGTFDELMAKRGYFYALYTVSH